MPTKQKNIITKSIIITTLTLAIVFSAAAVPEPAQAQWATISTTIGDIPRKIGDIFKTIRSKAGSRAYQTAIRSVSFKLAQDTATWIASGGKGRKPLLFTSPKKFLTETADTVAGKYLANLSSGWPINICNPSSIKSKLAITVGIGKSLGELQFPVSSTDTGLVGCKLSEIRNNFSEAVKAENFLVNVQTSFDPGKSDLSIASALLGDIKIKKEQEVAAGTLERQQAGGELESKKTAISGDTQTTSSQLKTAEAEAQKKATDAPPRTEDIFIDTLAVFTNTLTRAYLQKLQRGYYPFRESRKAVGPDSELEGSAGSLRALLTSFDVFSPQRGAKIESGGEIDLFSDMVSCPSPQYQTPYNCLLSDGLQQAVQQGLTVKQAADRGLIDSNLQFPEVHDPNKPNLSLYNLRKLRFLRVIPVGWEIAAQYLIDAKKTVPFDTLLSCFSDSGFDGCNVPTVTGEERNLEKLVDPEWVFSLPQLFCRAEGFSNVPEHEKSSSRREFCVDLQSCIKKDANGRCESYGYCTRERQVWQLEGQQCEPQYATCRTLRRKDNATLSILGSDVNKAGCTQSSAGCAWYSRSGHEFTWEQNPRIYLTDVAQRCRVEDAGSREIIPLEPGVNLATSDASGQTIGIKPYTYYTLSFSIASIPSPSASITVVGSDGQVLRNVSFSSPPPSTPAPGNESNTLVLNLDGSVTPGRYAATFYSLRANGITLTLESGATAVQLEEVSLAVGEQAVDRVKDNAALGPSDLNYSPPGSRNTASPATAYKSYSGNRRLVFAGANSCEAEETSARKYTSALSGESRIARISSDNLCAKECSGLESFLAMPTPIERLSSGAASSRVSFISSTAQSCSASEVGCEEFTNLSQTGPEKKEYYSRIRSCVADSNPNSATFYTWEGTDTSGFQLKAWQLLRDPRGGPCTNFPRANNTANAQEAACDTTNPAEACVIEPNNPNCLIFLDEAGVEYRRDTRKIVSARADCSAYRRSKDASTDLVWYFSPAEAQSCGSSSVGCREYKGGRANLLRTVLATDFEQNSGDWHNGEITSESYVTGGKSYRIAAGNGNDISYLFTSGSFVGKSYTLDFDAKAASTDAVFDLIRLKISEGSNQRNYEFVDDGGPSLPVALEWRHYTVGPVFYESIDPTYDAMLPGLLMRAQVGDIYIDNIKLTETENRIYALEKSTLPKAAGGKQPDACYNNPATAPLPKYENCQAWRDGSNNTFYISRFGKLFTDESLFCKAVIDTQNSDSPQSETFNTGNDSGSDPDRLKDNITVPADNLEYRLIKPENLRAANTAGCTELGLPETTNSDGVVESWRPEFKTVDPDSFNAGSLCLAEGVGCQTYKDDDGGSYVFKDPGNRLCEWNGDGEFVQLSPEDGTQTSFACPGGYVRKCPAEQSGCTAYLPTDPSLSEGANTALYMFKPTVEPGQCKTGDKIESGCVEFTEGYPASVSAYPPDLRNPEPLPDLLAGSAIKTLTVKPERQCAEWLAPTTTSETTDARARSVRTVVYNLGRCQELEDNGQCKAWVNQTPDALDDFPEAYTSGGSIGKFSVPGYASRLGAGGSLKKIYSGAWDYSGYSIPNQYPIELLSEDTSARAPVLKFGSVPATASLACRSYPEEDAPFSSELLQIDSQTGKFSYSGDTKHLQNLNVCAKGENCECSYKKVVTKDGANQYYGFSTAKPLPEDVESITNLVGWKGYCVEWDEESRDPNNKPVCLTWWPKDVVQSGTNVFDNHPEAGFTSSGPQYYCLEAKGNKYDNYNLVTEKVEKNNYFVKLKTYDDIDMPAAGLYPIYYDSGIWGALGWDGASGILQWKVKNSTGVMKNLSEYDIEAIILKVTNRQAGDWPPKNEEFILRREGFAKSTSSSPETKDRWTALWCGGGGSEQCEYNGVYTWEKFASVVSPAGTGSCHSDFIGSTNLFAFRARFADGNGNGGEGWEGNYKPYQFLGFEGGSCDATKKSGWVSFSITFQLREWCSKVAQVSRDSNNKAWTARLNQKSVTSDPNGRFSAISNPEMLQMRRGVGLGYSYSQDKPPFGALVPPVSTIYIPEEWDSRKDTDETEDTPGKKEITILEPGKQPLYIEAARNQIRGGSPYSCQRVDKCVVPPTEKGAELRLSNLDEATLYLQQLFAEIYDIWEWDEDSYQLSSAQSANRDLTKKTEGVYWRGECPIIQAAQIQADGSFRAVEEPGGQYRYKNQKGEGDCVQQQYWGAYSANGMLARNDDGNRIISDSTIPDAKIGKPVAIQFYAYNDNGEQLPLKEIEIDWHDGEENKTIIRGDFRNHKAACSDSSDNYGDTSKACESAPFQFKHVYGQEGSYTPIVSVKDNWGRRTLATYSGSVGVIRVVSSTLSTAPHSEVDMRYAAAAFREVTPPLADMGLSGQYYNNASNRGLSTVEEITTRMALVKTIDIDEQPISFPSPQRRESLPGGVGDEGGQYFGVIWTGFLKIDNPGQYVFKLWSDDGSKLMLKNLGGSPLATIDNDGEHRYRDRSSAPVTLDAGKYEIEIKLFNKKKTWGLVFEWKMPGRALFTPVPLENLLPLATKIDGGWGEWGACTRDCGGGVQVHNCDNPSPRNGGALCLKTDGTPGTSESKSCNTEECPPPPAPPPTESVSCPAGGGNNWCLSFNRHIDDYWREPSLVTAIPFETSRQDGSAIDYRDDNLRRILPSGWSSTFYGIRFLGRLNTTVNGVYRFRLGVDDGADLVIDNERVVYNPGDHGYERREGNKSLSPGAHLVQLRMYNNGGPGDLTLEWWPPNASDYSILPMSAIEYPGSGF